MKKYIFIPLVVLSASTGLAVTFYRQQDQNPQASRRPVPHAVIEAKREARFNKFVALLGTVGITVDKSYLHDAHTDKSHKAFDIKWEAYSGAPQIIEGDKHQYPTSNKFTVKEVKTIEGGVYSPREPDFDSDELFIAAVDNQSRLVWWTKQHDTRVMFLDGQNPDGTMTGGRVSVGSPSLFLEIPEDSRIKEIRVYEFTKTSGELALNLINSISVN